MGHSRLTNLCVLHRSKEPLYHGPEVFGSRESAGSSSAFASHTKWGQENDSYYWRQRKRWQGGFAGSDREGLQGPRHVQVQGRGCKSAIGMRGRAGGLCGQEEPPK